MKSQTHFKIEALKQALLNLKLDKNREIEQIKMYASEVESKFLRIYQTELDLSRIIEKVEAGEGIHTVNDAKA
jgi:hypothetical protein